MVTEELWKEWIECQKSWLKLVTKNDLLAASGQLDLFLSKDLPDEVRSEALMYKGITKERSGDSPGALAELLAAHALSGPATYHRYALELTLGSIYRSMHDIGSSRSWFICAIETALGDPSTSGVSAVEGLLEVSDISCWSESEYAMCEKAVRQAWTLFSLPGEPSLQELDRTLHILTEASMRPLQLSSD